MSITVPLDPSSRDITDVPLPERSVLRDRRRTSLVTMTRTGEPEIRDECRLCWPDCVAEMLLDLGIRGRGSAFVFPPRGSATTSPRWNGATYDVSWARQRTSAMPCDICDADWRFHIPAAVATAAARSERMKGTTPPWRRPGGRWHEAA